MFSKIAKRQSKRRACEKAIFIFNLQDKERILLGHRYLTQWFCIVQRVRAWYLTALMLSAVIVLRFWIKTYRLNSKTMN